MRSLTERRAAAENGFDFSNYNFQI